MIDIREPSKFDLQDCTTNQQDIEIINKHYLIERNGVLFEHHRRYDCHFMAEKLRTSLRTSRKETLNFKTSRISKQTDTNLDHKEYTN